MAYLDDIIIYLNSKEERKEYIEWVLRKLYKENILVAIKKYKFHIKKTDFVGFVVKLGQISMDLKKIKTIVNWQDLESVIGLRLFLRFYNYYCRFIAK
jgi:ribosome-interacting GTPase 1